MGGGVEGLTTEQRALTRSVCQQWLEHGLTLRPADRATAEAGVGLVYREAGLPPPRRVVWAGSPLAGVVAALALTAASDPDLPDVPQLWEQSWAELAAQTAMPAGDPVWAHLRHEQVGAAVDARVGAAGEAIWQQVRGQIMEAEMNWQLGEEVRRHVREPDQDWEWRWDHERWPRLLARVARGAWLPPWELVVVPPRTGSDGWEEWHGAGGNPGRRSSGR
jgi:hypothetical protein